VVFANTVNNAGYDLVLLGQTDPRPINLDEWEAKLQRPEYQTNRAIAPRDWVSHPVWICSRPMRDGRRI